MTETGGNWEEAVRWLIEQSDKQDLVEACYYDAPHHRAVERYHSSDEWRAIGKLLPAVAGTALDVGAGNGIVSYALARDGWQVTALEPDPSSLVGAQAIRNLSVSQALPITVVEQWGEDLPFADHSFDTVIARQVLHHARSLSGICAQIHRVLRPGGTFLALRDHVISSDTDKEAFFQIHPLHYRYGGENAYRLSEYRGALLAAGFEIKRVLKSFDSPINLAPLSIDGLRNALIERSGRAGLPRPLARVLTMPMRYDAVARLASLIDRRPGRLVSFVCRKP